MNYATAACYDPSWGADAVSPQPRRCSTWTKSRQNHWIMKNIYRKLTTRINDWLFDERFIPIRILSREEQRGTRSGDRAAPNFTFLIAKVAQFLICHRTLPRRVAGRRGITSSIYLRAVWFKKRRQVDRPCARARARPHIPVFERKRGSSTLDCRSKERPISGALVNEWHCARARAPVP